MSDQPGDVSSNGASAPEPVIDLPPDWMTGEPVRLPLRGDIVVGFRPQVFAHETIAMGKASRAQKEEDQDLSVLRLLAYWIDNWTIPYVAGPKKGQPIEWPEYDPYDLDAKKRGAAIQRRVDTLTMVATGDILHMQTLLGAVQKAVNREYADPLSRSGSTTDSESASV